MEPAVFPRAHAFLVSLLMQGIELVVTVVVHIIELVMDLFMLIIAAIGMSHGGSSHANGGSRGNEREYQISHFDISIYGFRKVRCGPRSLNGCWAALTVAVHAIGGGGQRLKLSKSDSASPDTSGVGSGSSASSANLSTCSPCAHRRLSLGRKATDCCSLAGRVRHIARLQTAPQRAVEAGTDRIPVRLYLAD